MDDGRAVELTVSGLRVLGLARGTRRELAVRLEGERRVAIDVPARPVSDEHADRLKTGMLGGLPR